MKLGIKKEDDKKLIKQATRKKDTVTRRVGKQDNAESTSLNQNFKLEKNRELTINSQPWLTPGTEIAIIGYWKRDDIAKVNNEWRCYFYFDIPHPIKREVRRSSVKDEYSAAVSEKQVLFVTSTEKSDTVFFFHKD